MATIYERVELYRASIMCSPLTLPDKADLGEIIYKEFLLAGYQKNQTALYRSEEPEGYFTVINYPNSFTEKIDQCIVAFFLKKFSPPDPPKEEVTPTVTQVKKRKRMPANGRIKHYSAKPENK